MLELDCRIMENLQLSKIILFILLEVEVIITAYIFLLLPGMLVLEIM